MGIEKKHLIFTRNGISDNETDWSAVESGLLDNSGSNEPIVLLFHGGLVNKNVAMKGANENFNSIVDLQAYPIYFIWNSGLMGALIDVMGPLLIRKFFRGSLDTLTRFIKGKVNIAGMNGMGFMGVSEEEYWKVSATDMQLIQEAVMQNQDLLDEEAALGMKGFAMNQFTTREISDVGKAFESEQADITQKINSAKPPADANAMAMNWLQVALAVAEIGGRVLYRYHRKREHELRSTIIEEILRYFEIGTLVWSEMKSDARKHFKSNGAATRLIQTLSDPRLQHRQIILVGHSTGAIFINEFLTHWPAGREVHLRYLAGAARCDDTWNSWSANSAKIASVRCFQLNAKQEAEAELIGEGLAVIGEKMPWIKDLDWLEGIYLGSLLYLVSGSLEDPSGDTPLVGMDRFVGNRMSTSNLALTATERSVVTNIRDFILNHDPIGFVSSPTSGSAETGTGCLAKMHGDFGKDVDMKHFLHI